MNILAIDTATDICSVSLYLNRIFIDTKSSFESRSHSKTLAVFVQELLNINNISISKLDAIAISTGPGSYTGLRIGFSFVKGLAYPYKLPIIMVPTFLSLEYQVTEIKPHYIVIHSHSDLVYAQKFENHKSVGEINNIPYSEISNKKLYGYGLKNKYFSANYVEIIPSAKFIGKLGIDYFNDWKETKMDKIRPNYINSINIRKK